MNHSTVSPNTALIIYLSDRIPSEQHARLTDEVAQRFHGGGGRGLARRLLHGEHMETHPQAARVAALADAYLRCSPPVEQSNAFRERCSGEVCATIQKLTQRMR